MTEKSSSANRSAPTRYRPCVGAMVVNRSGRVWIGKRSDNAEHIGANLRWQMPQGGIDPGEDAEVAVLRELAEETNITSVKIRAETARWLRYDLPENLIGTALRGKYRGQEQKWFLLDFYGADDEIDILTPGGGAHDPEFDAWKWADPTRVVDLIVPFKRGVYEQMLAEFLPMIGPARS